MDFFTAFNVSASGLSAQRIRMNTVASNLANVNSTKSSNGSPYKRKDVVFTAVQAEGRFDDILRGHVKKVDVVEVIEDPRPFKTVYDPYHPDANKEGYVSYPNINVIEEMVNMLSASRAYEANVNAIKTTKSMAMKALGISR